jgi:hypothetical protein
MSLKKEDYELFLEKISSILTIVMEASQRELPPSEQEVLSVADMTQWIQELLEELQENTLEVFESSFSTNLGDYILQRANRPDPQRTILSLEEKYQGIAKGTHQMCSKCNLPIRFYKGKKRNQSYIEEHQRSANCRIKQAMKLGKKDTSSLKDTSWANSIRLQAMIHHNKLRQDARRKIYLFVIKRYSK